MKKRILCAECGSADVQITAWIHANSREVVDGDSPTTENWCPQCDMMVDVYEEDDIAEVDPDLLEGT